MQSLLIRLWNIPLQRQSCSAPQSSAIATSSLMVYSPYLDTFGGGSIPLHTHRCQCRLNRVVPSLVAPILVTLLALEEAREAFACFSFNAVSLWRSHLRSSSFSGADMSANIESKIRYTLQKQRKSGSSFHPRRCSASRRDLVSTRSERSCLGSII